MYVDASFVVAALAILATMTLAMVRALLGPTVYDRVLAVNMFGTTHVFGDPVWIEIGRTVDRH